MCINNRSQTLDAILENGGFAINVLRASQASVSDAFAGQTTWAEKFATVGYRLVHGSPVLDGALVAVVCDVHSTAPGGDHPIVLGRVTAIHTQAGEPLVHHGGHYRRLGAVVA